MFNFISELFKIADPGIEEVGIRKIKNGYMLTIIYVKDSERKCYEAVVSSELLNKEDTESMIQKISTELK